MNKKWVVATPTPLESGDVHNPILRRILATRGLTTQEAVEHFLYPDYTRDVHDPFLFRDMRTAIARIFAAIETQEKIIVHGDYDADGVCATAILCTTLRALNANVSFFLPHREHDGYGLNTNTIEKLAAENARLIITCDCGISNALEIALAHERGIDVIVTDHHQTPEKLPIACALLHPLLPGETYPDKTLSGGGVAFKLCQALLREHQSRGAQSLNGASHQAFEKWLLDLVAISSVADMVPLLHETRALTHFGLTVLNKTRRIGLQKLLDTTRNGRSRAIDTGTIGFSIAPRINAAGRMEHANEALELLLAQDETQAITLAQRIDFFNTNRQKQTDELTKRGREMIHEHHDADADPILFVRGDGWSPGIIGLIASRLKDEFGKPIIVLGEGDGSYVGSGRSIPQLHITNALAQVPHFFKKFGGHPQACGFTLARKDVYDDFTAAMTAIAARELAEKDLTPFLTIDAEITLHEITNDFCKMITRCAPFGIGNPEPIFLIRKAQIIDVRLIGAEGRHARLLIRQDNIDSHTGVQKVQKVICFSCRNRLMLLQPHAVVDMVCTIGTNEWNGKTEPEIKLVDVRPVTTTQDAEYISQITL